MHTCALLTDGRVACWGANLNNELGRGPDQATETVDMTAHWEPGWVAGVDKVTDIAAGAYRRVCVIRKGGEVWCWGGVDDPSDGLAVGAGPRTVPVAKRDLHFATPAERVFRMGDTGTCVLSADGRPFCWYRSGTIKFNGKTVPNFFPGPDDMALVDLTVPAAWVRGEYYNAQFLRRDGRVATRGDNRMGSAGIGSKEPPWVNVALAEGLTCASALASSIGEACAIRTNGALWCWGPTYTIQWGTGVNLAPVPMIDLRAFP